MEFVPPGGVCCRRPPEHSRQFFDWWRISCDGMIVQEPPPPTPPPAMRPFPLKKSELCWPLTHGCEAKPPDKECHVDRDFWPDKTDEKAKRVTPFSQSHPWKPAKLPNEFGVIKYAPPYTRYCRDREKPLNFVCKA
ncbi:hypothetical protein BsWGS_01574 [Bradybaena similaris]